jgi:hypothetical protein
MVTHRWWGNKFCKRTCKGAYLRELALGRDKIRRRYAFFRGGWLSRAAPCRQMKTRSRARCAASSQLCDSSSHERVRRGAYSKCTRDISAIEQHPRKHPC